MCGVVGYYCEHPEPKHAEWLEKLFIESKIRGLHAFGLGWNYLGVNATHRSFVLDETVSLMKTMVCDGQTNLIAHARYSTSGDWEVLANNQPVALDGRVLVFNGVIDMGTKAEMEARYAIRLYSYNDGEVFLNKLTRGQREAVSLVDKKTVSFAGLWLEPTGALKVLRNPRRPLWYYRDGEAVFLASTQDIFYRALNVEPTRVLANNAIYDARDLGRER